MVPYECSSGPRRPLLLRRHRGAVLFSAAVVTLLVTTTAFKIWLRLSQMVHTRSSKQTAILVLKDCISLFTIVSAIYKDIFGNTKKFEFIFNNLEHAHFIMSKDDTDHNKMSNFIMFQIVSSSLMLASLFSYAFVVQTNFFDRLVLSSGQLMVCIMVVICLRFVNLVLIVGNHFKELNKCLDMSDEDIEIPRRSRSQDACSGERVRELRTVYELLSEVSRHVVSSHDPSITCGLGYFLVTVIYTAYAISATDESMLMFSAVQLLNCVFLLVLVLPVHVTQSHAAAVTRSVSRSLLVQSARSDAEKELQLFLQNVSARSVEFCAVGVIRLDLSLLAAFVGTVTTYMVLFFTFK